MERELSLVRNFSIIAHIDHGKSTLADRLLELTHTIEDRKMRDQVLDRMDLEREKGITIKAQAVTMLYEAGDGKSYELNLIDTPGHVDFSYEVSRSLKACEGAILLVDATQGVEAQTLANLFLALDSNLEVLPVINKIDLPVARIQSVVAELDHLLGASEEEVLLVSAKEGQGIEELLESVVKRLPHPKGDAEEPLRALIFDSHYDSYRGVVCYVRVFDGRVKAGDRILIWSTGREVEVEEVGLFKPELRKTDELTAGSVGYIMANIKIVKDARVGDTITHKKRPCAMPLPGFRRSTPMIYCGFYTTQGEDYESLRDALDKLSLNDASLAYEPESSTALGLGFRCGFLGLLHMEIVQERLEREYGISLIATSPNVVYKAKLTSGGQVTVEDPSKMPEETKISIVEEPIMEASIITPVEYMSAVMDLARSRRGELRRQEYLSQERVSLAYDLPLNEIIFDFYNALKSISRGYASLDYRFKEYRPAKLVKVDILLNNEIVEPLSFITHYDSALSKGRRVTQMLKEYIPRHLFAIPIQAAVGKRIIARETISAKRKDVLAKCYGGDITRKRKLLEKQKEGKKRMRQFGKVQIPQEAFLAVLRAETWFKN